MIGRLQPGADGTGRARLHAGEPGLRRVPAPRDVRGAQGRDAGRLSREGGQEGTARAARRGGCRDGREGARAARPEPRGRTPEGAVGTAGRRAVGRSRAGLLAFPAGADDEPRRARGRRVSRSAQSPARDGDAQGPRRLRPPLKRGDRPRKIAESALDF